MSADTGEPRAQEFAEAFVNFVRGFGLLEAETTPCGAPMSPAEAHALTILRTGGLHQGVLGERLNLGKSSMSRLVDGLAQRGWVRREADPRDGRARLLVLTDKGTGAAAEVLQRRAQRLSGLLNHIPPAQRSTVIEALRLLTEAGHHDEP
jgi:DNA-binding MarR family transcriptional regulator